MNKPKIGLIGIGRMGKNHLRVLSMLSDIELQFIYDTDYERADSLAKQYNVSVSENLDKDLQNVDAVVVATPSATHYDLLKKVCAQVNTIFIEKPMTHSLEKSKEILSICRQKGIKIQVGFIERFNSATQALDQAIKNAGNIIHIDFVRTSKLSNRIKDVDVITDLMVHDIDLAIYFNGAVKYVRAYGVKEDEMIVYARASLCHSNGTFSNITASRITEKKMRTIGVTCSDSYIDCDLLGKQVYINKQNNPIEYGDMVINSVHESVFVKPDEALMTQMQAFSKYIHDKGGIDIPSPDDDVKAMTIAVDIRNQILAKKQD